MSPTIAASLVAFALLLIVLEAARRGLGVAPDVTRKLFHMGVGVWALAAVAWLDGGADAATAFLILAAVMYLSFRFDIFEAVEDDGPSLGSVLLPLSCALLLYWFRPDFDYVAVAGIFAASFGDTFAALIGRRMGSRKYYTLGHPRSMEGTLTLFLASGLSMALVLATVGGLDSHQAVAFALIAATVAASAETISVYGLDNFTVPVAAAATIATLIRFSQ